MRGIKKRKKFAGIYKCAAHNSRNVTLVAKWDEARDLQLADRSPFHNLFATRLDPPALRNTCCVHQVRKVPSSKTLARDCINATGDLFEMQASVGSSDFETEMRTCEILA